MKKIILSLVVMFSSVAAFAQHEVGSLTIQPKIGLSIANVTKITTDSRVGLAIGAEAEYTVADIVSLSGGVLYSMQGAKRDGYTSELDYINIPLLVNVYPVKNLAVKIGLQPGFMVGNNEKVDDGLKKFDLSLPIGVSYEYRNFVLDGRYNFGLTKIQDGIDSKNSVFQITLGYKFAL